MSREYYVMFLTMAMQICVLMSTETEAQPTVDDGGSCYSSLPTSGEVANLIREGLKEVIASNQQQSTPMDATKHSLVSALACEYIRK